MKILMVGTDLGTTYSCVGYIGEYGKSEDVANVKSKPTTSPVFSIVVIDVAANQAKTAALSMCKLMSDLTSVAPDHPITSISWREGTNWPTNEYEVLVKFGDAHRVEREYSNFKEYVRPFLGFSIDTNSNISFGLTKEWKIPTPLGVITLSGQLSGSLLPQLISLAQQTSMFGDDLLLIVRRKQHGLLQDSNYLIQAQQTIQAVDIRGVIDEVSVKWVGTHYQVFVDALDGSITTVDIQGNPTVTTSPVKVGCPSSLIIAWAMNLSLNTFTPASSTQCRFEWTNPDYSVFNWLAAQTSGNDSLQCPLGYGTASVQLSFPWWHPWDQGETQKCDGKTAIFVNDMKIVESVQMCWYDRWSSLAALTSRLEQEQEQILLVYDLGGGTSDITLINITADTIPVLFSNGYDTLSGKDRKTAVAEHLAQLGKSKRDSSTDPSILEKMLQDLWPPVQSVKQPFSLRRDTSVTAGYARLCKSIIFIDGLDEVKKVFPDKPVVVGETGWPSDVHPWGAAVPGAANQARYFREFTSWAQSKKVLYFYFDAFDEEWKGTYGNGEFGVGAYWGLYQQDRTVEPALSDALPNVASAMLMQRSFRDVHVGSSLKSPFDLGIDTSQHQYGWLTARDGWTANPHSGRMCIRVDYNGAASQGNGWAGVYWQDPVNNWGKTPGPTGYDLSHLSKLTFWAHGDVGGEQIEFKVGGITGPYGDSLQPAINIGILMLTTSWQQVAIDLTGKNLTYIIGGFVWVANTTNNPNRATFYLDVLNGGHLFVYHYHSRIMHTATWSADGSLRSSGSESGRIIAWWAANRNPIFIHSFFSGRAQVYDELNHEMLKHASEQSFERKKLLENSQEGLER